MQAIRRAAQAAPRARILLARALASSASPGRDTSTVGVTCGLLRFYRRPRVQVVHDMCCPPAGAIPLEEYKRRREQFGSRLPPGFVGVLVGSVTQYMAPDIPYRWRQDSDFRHLTGFLEPDAVLVIRPRPECTPGSPDSVVSTLVVQGHDPHHELWNGPRGKKTWGPLVTCVDHRNSATPFRKATHHPPSLTQAGVEGALQLGVEEAGPLSHLPGILETELKGAKGVWTNWTNDSRFANGAFVKALQQVSTGSDQELEIQSIDASDRVFKSSSEIAIMREACEISSRGMQEVLLE